MTDEPAKRIIIAPPDGSTILAARHLDATEGPVQVGSTVDTATRSAITRVLNYVARAHNSYAEADSADAAAGSYALRAERVEAQLAAVADLIADHEGDDWASHPATSRLRATLDDDQPPAASCSPAAPETEPNNSRTTPDNPVICELPHQIVAEEDECERQRLAPADGAACSCGGRFPVHHLHADEHQPVDEPAAWTPPPPGDRREQLPDHLLDLIRDRLPDYVSTACQTADALACTATYRHPRYDEIRAHAERLHQRCRTNQKFTGQMCACGCHHQAAPAPDFTSPIAGRIEVRDPCPWCGDRQMIPRHQYAEHVARLHPDVHEGGPGILLPDAEQPARTTSDNPPTSSKEIP